MVAVERKTCAGCGGDILTQFLDLGSTPPANSMSAEVDVARDRYPLRVAVCEDCWLVQLVDVVPDEELFAGDYAFHSGTSPALVAYHEAQANELLATHCRGRFPFVVEVASNDGDLLRHFHASGVRSLGVDPAVGPAEVARERGLDVLTEPFGVETALRIREDWGRATLVVANNVAAHVTDVLGLLRGMAALLTSDGVAVVEVQYVADLLLGNQFDQVYHEHRYFLSVTSMTYLCQRVGLNVLGVVETTPQGGSVQFTLGRNRHPAALFTPDERWLRDPRTYASVQARADRARDKLRDLVSDVRSQDRKVAGWAAPAKATTLLNFCGFGADNVCYVEDGSPSKHGRYVAGTDIPVVPHGKLDPRDVYLLLGWNYLRTFVDRNREFLDAGGRFIVPLPNPVML